MFSKLRTLLGFLDEPGPRLSATAKSADGKPYTIDAALRDYFAPVRRAHGFKGSGRHFRRVTGGLFEAVNVQGSMGGGMFAVNLGIHPLNLPVFLDEPLDVKKARELECEFRGRLSEEGGDRWWPYSDSRESMIGAARAAAAIFERYGLAIFQKQADPDGPLFSMTPAEWTEGAHPLLGFGNSYPRMALALARMRKQQGKLIEARDFARLGLNGGTEGWLGQAALRQLADEGA